MLYGAALDSSGDLPVRCTHVSGLDLVLQRIPRRLGLHLGEWFAQPALGLPWRAWMQQRPPDVTGIGAAIRVVLGAVPEVTRVDDWSGAYVASTRGLAFAATVRTPYGDAAISLALGAPGAGSIVPAVVFRVLAGASVLTR